MFEVQTGEKLWEKDMDYDLEIFPLTCSAVSYIVFRLHYADCSFLICIDKKTGKEVWESECPGPDGTLGFVLFETGAMKRMKLIVKGCQPLMVRQRRDRLLGDVNLDGACMYSDEPPSN